MANYKKHETVARPKKETTIEKQEVQETQESERIIQIRSIERGVVGNVIANNSIDRVIEILKNYKWNDKSASIYFGACNHLYIHREHININTAQLAVVRLYPDLKIVPKALSLVQDRCNQEQLIPFARKLIELAFN